MDKAPDAFRTISEVADDLDVPQHVLRFWETRFPQIKPMKRGGGRRYYRPDDVDLLRGIRHLLYGEGYTIRGVQRLLKDNGLKFVQAVWRPDAPPVGAPPADEIDDAASDIAAHEDVTRIARAEPQPQAESLKPSAQRRSTDFAATTRLPASESRSPARPEGGDGDATPSTERVPPSAEPTTAANGARLSSEDRRRLQAALYELGECRRLLDAALKDE